MNGMAINLCFHGIGQPRRELEPGEDRYWITVDQYHRILDEVAGWPNLNLSFDDGNLSDLEFGVPGLLERELQATFFLIAGRVGEHGSMDPIGVRTLRETGMTVGTHGMEHRPWRGLPECDRLTELVEARLQLEGIADQPIDQAALPLGRYDRRLLAELRKLGYRRVFSSDRRKARPNAWFQPRFSVVSTDTAQSLRQQVLHGPGLLGQARSSAKGLIKQLR